MFQLFCPHCQDLRSGVEFEFTRDAAPSRPPLAVSVDESGSSEELYRYVYLKANVRGRTIEYWQHRHGCRGWLIVERDTLTHAVFEVRPTGVLVQQQRSATA